MRPRKQTDDQMLDALGELALRLGRTPSVADVDRTPGMVRASCYVLRFGKFTEACRLAGLQPNRFQMGRRRGS